MKSKADAARFLVVEARKETGTRARMKRTEKALRILGLDPEEAASIMCYLDYYESMDGTPFPKYRDES